MNAQPVPEFEPAVPIDEVMAAVGWSKATVHKAIRQGVIPGTAFKPEGSEQFVYAVPRPAFRRWLENPSRVVAPTPLIRRVEKGR